MNQSSCTWQLNSLLCGQKKKKTKTGMEKSPKNKNKKQKVSGHAAPEEKKDEKDDVQKTKNKRTSKTKNHIKEPVGYGSPRCLLVLLCFACLPGCYARSLDALKPCPLGTLGVSLHPLSHGSRVINSTWPFTESIDALQPAHLGLFTCFEKDGCCWAGFAFGEVFSEPPEVTRLWWFLVFGVSLVSLVSLCKFLCFGSNRNWGPVVCFTPRKSKRRKRRLLIHSNGRQTRFLIRRQIWSCRRAGLQRLPGARLACRRRRHELCCLRISWRYKRNPFASPSGGETFSPSQVDLLKNVDLEGGAAGSARSRRLRQKTSGNNDLARNLIHQLKATLNGNGSWDQMLRVVEKLVDTSPPKKKSHKRKKKLKYHPNPAAAQSGTIDRSKDVRYWYDSSGGWRAYSVDADGWWSWCDTQAGTSTNLRPTRAQPEQGQLGRISSTHTPNRNSDPAGLRWDSRFHHWISGLRVSDWNPAFPPKLIPFGRLKANLRDSVSPEGNLIEMWNPDDVAELRSLWTGFEQAGGLTAVLCGSAMQMPGAFPTRLSFARGRNGSQLENVALLQIGSRNNPWTHLSKKVKVDDVPQVQRETV